MSVLLMTLIYRIDNWKGADGIEVEKDISLVTAMAHSGG